MTIDYALYEISYANMILYMATLPSYDSYKDKSEAKKKDRGEVINADDPANREKVEKMLFG